MGRPVSWEARAWNPVPESENRIHSDEVARAHGFRGGLVPGVVVSAYLLHPAAVAWGSDFAARGRAHVRVDSPVYDGERFRVEVDDASPHGYDARLVDEHGVAGARAEVALPDDPGEAPRRRDDPPLARDLERPRASRRVMEELRASGLGALRARFDAGAEMTSYLRDPQCMAPVYAREGLASPAFVLGLSNWALAGNVRMSPWLHLETHSRSFAPIPRGCELVVESAIADLFERRGHEFVDVEVAVFDRAGDRALAGVRLRAIYRLRGA